MQLESTKKNFLATKGIKFKNFFGWKSQMSTMDSKEAKIWMKKQKMDENRIKTR
jgi:hypothetical protein